MNANFASRLAAAGRRIFFFGGLARRARFVCASPSAFFLTPRRTHPPLQVSFLSSAVLSEELSFVTDGVELLRRIRDAHAEQGRTFLLPWGDPDAIDKAVKPMQHLLDEGVTPEFLFDACIKREELFIALTRRGSLTLEHIQLLMEYTGITYENAIRFIADWTNELLDVTPASVQERVNVFLSRGILSGPQIFSVLRKCPPLLFAVDAPKMDVALETIAEFFGPEEMHSIMLTSPQVSLQDPEELVLRYEYVYFHMGIEPEEEFVECIHWHDLPLEEIMARHECLKRTGKYLLPDPKRPQLKMENPPMFRIFDTDDVTFATQVAGIRLDEWTLFREIFAKERAQLDLDRPYERIKFSMRKAYQRKQAAERAEQARQDALSDEAYSF